MNGTWLALGLSVLAATAATLYLRLARLPASEIKAGVAALPTLRWRDFLNLVLAALERMGFRRLYDPDETGEGSDLQVERDGERWLLSAKHGASFVLGQQQIREFARAIEMKSAVGGLLVTPGTFATDAAQEAARQRIELIDGKRLWPEVEPLLDPQQRRAFLAPARKRINTGIALCWLMAAAIGVGSLLLMPRTAPPPATSAEAPAPASASASAPARPAPAPAMDAAAIPTDPALLAQRRKQLVDAVATLDMVEKAQWNSESTLVIELSRTGSDAKATFCPLVGKYTELRATRLQLQPPRESGQIVQFVQCWMY